MGQTVGGHPIDIARRDADDAPLDNREAADLFRHGGDIKRPKKRFAVRLPEPQSALSCALT